MDSKDVTTINYFRWILHWGSRIWCRFIWFHRLQRLLRTREYSSIHLLLCFECRFDLTSLCRWEYHQLDQCYLPLNRTWWSSCFGPLDWYWRVLSPTLNPTQIILCPCAVELYHYLSLLVLIYLCQRCNLELFLAFCLFFISTMIWCPRWFHPT